MIQMHYFFVEMHFFCRFVAPERHACGNLDIHLRYLCYLLLRCNAAAIHRESEKGNSRKLGFRYTGFSEI
jgi:hypothetical protein